jgi:hypothetical protein
MEQRYDAVLVVISADFTVRSIATRHPPKHGLGSRRPHLAEITNSMQS